MDSSLFFGGSVLAAVLAGSVSLFAPCIFVEGAPFSYGRLSERKLRRELERRPGPHVSSTDG